MKTYPKLDCFPLACKTSLKKMSEVLHTKEKTQSLPGIVHLKFDNGEEIFQRALFIAFANSNQFGYNTTIAPEASLVDGLMDICIVDKPKIYNLPSIANLLLLRKIELSPFVRIIKAKKVTVTRKKKRVVNIDGEPIKFEKKLEVKINPLSLT